MTRGKLCVSPAFLLLASLVVFFDSTGTAPAALPAIAVHELGHAAALRLCGCGIRRLNIGLFGLTMDYSGALTKREEIFSALAGPCAGVLFAVPARFIGMLSDSRFLLSTADISLLLSVFNMLPALPLDGGRVLARAAGERAAAAAAAAVGAVMLAAGLVFIARGYGAAMLMCGGWLLLYSCKLSSNDVK